MESVTCDMGKDWIIGTYEKDTCERGELCLTCGCFEAVDMPIVIVPMGAGRSDEGYFRFNDARLDG